MSSLKTQCLKRWLSPKDLEDEFEISRSSQAKMRMESNNSSLPFSKIGKFIKYDRIEIDKWFENNRVQ